MGYTLYSPEAGADVAIRTALALTPLALVTVVARRMGRGWLVSALPWLCLAVAVVIYAGPLMQLYPVNGASGTWISLAHLFAEVAPFATILSLAVLAALGAKQAANSSEAT